MSSTLPILVTGATGKQGGAVINSLLARSRAQDFLILAVTRDAKSSSAAKLEQKGDNVKVVQGNLDHVIELYDEAEKVAGKKIWGVYSVQISQGKGVTFDGEVRQGTQLFDEAQKRGVQQFVYSSVERGGDAASWENQTPIDHFRTKYTIEHHIKDNTGSMNWTILRPVAFMDNLAPGMESSVFLTAMRDSLKGKKQQWVAVSDIGTFAAMAFQDPQKFRGKAIGLAGDDLTFDEQQDIFQKITTAPPTPTFWFLGSLLKYMITELGIMINWFGTDGYKADIEGLRKINPDLKTFETWLKTDSSFPLKA